MAGRKARARRAKPSFEKRVDDFGEEVGRLGEKFGKEAEYYGRHVERRWHSAFGFFGPLIASIFGIILLGLGVWLLGFCAETAELSFLLAVKGFLSENLGLLFLLFLFFNYADYFSKAYSKAYRTFSPLVKAAGIVVVVWIVANMIIISGVSLGTLGLKEFAEFALKRLFWIFAFFAVLGYIVLLVTKPSKAKKEEVFLARTKQREKTGQVRRLYRSGREKILGGVCGGIAEYLNVDPVLVRLLWVFGTLISLGTGVLLYIIAWIIIPRNPEHKWE